MFFRKAGMDFTEILNCPMNEPALLERVIQLYLETPEEGPQSAYFLKIEHSAPLEFKVISVKKYPTPLELMDDYFSGPNGQTGIFIKSVQDIRTVMIIGFTLYGEVKIHPDKQLERFVMSHPFSDFNADKLPPLELLQLVFAELGTAVSALKDRKPA